MVIPEIVDSSQNDPNPKIHRWDFTSSLKIGQLYDAFKDTGIDEFPWKSDIRHEVTETLFESECFFEGTNSNIARLLKIDRDQQLSLQSEICPTTNVSRLLFEPRSSAFLIYKVSRKIEKLDVRSESLRKGRLTPANRHATHLVKEIEYGALAVLQLCFTDGPNDSDELQKKLKSIREHCESNSELPEIPANMQLNFHCGTKFATNQLEAAISKMKSLKFLQSHDSRNRPIRCILFPLKSLPLPTQGTLNFFPTSAEDFPRFVQYFDEINLLKQKLNGNLEILKELIKKYKPFLMKKENKVVELAESPELVEQNLKGSISYYLEKARRENRRAENFSLKEFFEKIVYLDELHKSGVKLLEDSNALKRLGSLKTMIFVCGAWKTMSEQRETFASFIKNGTICAFIDLDLLKGMSGAPTKPEIYIYKEGTFFPSQDSQLPITTLPTSNSTTPTNSPNLINILLLGETGVGKSTLINTFLNSLAYESFGAAIENVILHAIPSHFRLKNQRILIGNVSEKELESYKNGESLTKHTKSYLIKADDQVIQIIDTPGMGDTAGPLRDAENFQNILDFIGNLEEIHGICILLKSNNSRMNIPFKYCINELLANLSVSAAKNIVFCFTNTRQTFYEPGESLTTLREFLSDLEKKGLAIDTTTKSLYCFESDAFRCMAARQSGFTLSESIIEYCHDSWEQNKKEIDRLLKHISTLSPHSVKESITLNSARRVVLTLYKPLAEISSQLLLDIEERTKGIDSIRGLKQTEKNFTKRLVQWRSEKQSKNLNPPIHVCNSKGCQNNMQLDNKHPPSNKCHLALEKAFSSTIVAPAFYQNDWNSTDYDIQPRDVICEACGCSRSSHSLWYHYPVWVEMPYEDRQSREVLNEVMHHKGQKELINESLDQEISKLELERKEILQAIAQFMLFLQKEAMVTMNDLVEESLLNASHDEQLLLRIGKGNQRRIEAYEKSLYEYQLQRNMLQTLHLNEKEKVMTPIEVHQKFQHLSKLPNAGGQIQSLLQSIKETQAKTFQVQQTDFDLTSFPMRL